MAAPTEAGAPPPGLAAYLQALWGQPLRLALRPRPAHTALAPRLSGEAGEAGEAERCLHLPWPAPAPGSALRWAEAAAAHAAAHARFGGAPQPRAGLKPVQQALLGVLEDARVEALAVAELPGLRGLWLPWHAGPDALQGLGFEALLARLARVLLDSGWRDRHPWVEKLRRGVQGPDGQALRQATPAALRQLASLLGHDIGQMRLPFNARDYRPWPTYRDDNQHLWCPEPERAPAGDPLDAEAAPARFEPAAALPSPPVAPTATADPAVPTQAREVGDACEACEEVPPGATPVHDGSPRDTPPTLQPEWDRRIGRYRPGWCQVRVEPAARAPGPPAPAPPGPAVPAALRAALARPAGPWRLARKAATEGEALHPVAALEALLAPRLGQAPDARVYQPRRRETAPLALALLLDVSASSAEPGPDGLTPLALMRPVVAQTLAALQAQGQRSAAWAFASRGRQQVSLQGLKDWDERVDPPALQARLAALRSGGSTRLGAVLRQALHEHLRDAARQPGWRRAIVLLGDGELHDIDVHEPGYLQADLARACREAAARGVAVLALVLPPGRPEALQRWLGPGRCAGLRGPAQLAPCLARLLAGLG